MSNQADGKRTTSGFTRQSAEVKEFVLLTKPYSLQDLIQSIHAAQSQLETVGTV